MKKLALSFFCLVFVAGFAAQTLSADVTSKPIKKLNLEGDWELELVESATEPPFLSLDHHQLEGFEVRIRKSKDDINWIIEYFVGDPTVDGHAPATLSFPDGTKVTLPILEDKVSGELDEGIYGYKIETQNSSLLDHLKKQRWGTLSFTDKETRETNIVYSLKGFGEAFAALEKAQKEFEQTQKPLSETKKPQSTPYGAWYLDTVSNGTIYIKHLLNNVVSKDNDQLQITVGYDNDLIIGFMFTPAADKTKEVILTCPDGYKKELHLVSCENNQCVAGIKEKAEIQELLAHFQSANSQKICILSYTNQANKPISFGFSLDGFNEGFKALQKVEAENTKRVVFADWKLSTLNNDEPNPTPFIANKDSLELNTFPGISIYQIKKDQPWSVTFFCDSSVDKDKNLTFILPDGTQRKLLIDYCTEKLCKSDPVPAETQEMLKQMQLLSEKYPGKPGFLTYTDKQGKEIFLPISLKGFNEAFAALEKAQKEFEQK